MCRQALGRINALRKFSKRNDVIIFVSGKKSSNGKALCGECKKSNTHAYMATDENEAQVKWCIAASSIDIRSTTSTPDWQMKNAATLIKTIVQTKRINQF